MSWEEIVDLAKLVDARAAARSGIDTEAALRLSRAILAFQQLIQRGPLQRPPQEPTGV
ncbi:MAG: hypothetical protein FWD17_13635 [Polyangiaceae bacterium]|nr:hypothetical protein [Polyangiaceae bacterium]